MLRLLRRHRVLLAGIVVLPILFVPALSAQPPERIPVARPVGSKVPVDLSAPPPQVRSIGGSPTTTALTWAAAQTGARLQQFEVARWHQAAPTCCTATVVIPVGQSTDGQWVDHDFPIAGRYVYRITSVYADGTRGAVQVDYLRPEPVNPASLRAVGQRATNTVQLTWPEVPQASFYQVWGLGIAGTGMTVMNNAASNPAVTQQVIDNVRYFTLSLTGLPIGQPQWSVGSFYEPPTCTSVPAGQPCQKVSTAATAFTHAWVIFR